MAGRLPASCQDAGCEDTGIEAVRLHPSQLVGQNLAGLHLDIEGILAGIGDERKGFHLLCPGAHVLAKGSGRAGEIVSRTGVVHVYLHNPLIVVEAVIG